MANRAGIAKSTLSQLESTSGNPSIETLWALCVALGVQFSQLRDPSPPQVQVIRAGERPVLASAQAEYRTTLLSASPPKARRDGTASPPSPGIRANPIRTRAA